MSSVCLKQKDMIAAETWSSVFPALGTEAKSNIFMKQLTTTCVSTILYLRKILPDEFFYSKQFEGMTLKFLKTGREYNHGNQIHNWLEGAYEAIEKKYLKQLMLDVKDKESKITYEVYTITYNYPTEKNKLNIFLSKNKAGKENFSGISISTTKINTIQLLQMCHAVTQSCTDLPTHVSIAIRLSYYEDTPEEYQPKGYKAYNPIEQQFLGATRSIEIGVTGTDHHSFKLVNKSCFNENFLKEQKIHEEKRVEQDGRDQGNLKNLKLKAKRELKFDEPTIPEKKACQEELTTINQTNLRLISSSKNKSTIVQKVRCPCLSCEMSETMFCCAVCKNLVHTECFGVLNFDAKKKVRFYCHICHQPVGKPESHDKVLTSLKNSDDQQKLALLRKILKHCFSWNLDAISFSRIHKIVGPKCSKETKTILLNKLMEIQILKTQKKKKSLIIDKFQLANKITRYFYQLEYSNKTQTQPGLEKDQLKRQNQENIDIQQKKYKKSTVIPQIFGMQNSQATDSQQSIHIMQYL